MLGRQPTSSDVIISVLHIYGTHSGLQRMWRLKIASMINRKLMLGNGRKIQIIHRLADIGSDLQNHAQFKSTYIGRKGRSPKQGLASKVPSFHHLRPTAKVNMSWLAAITIMLKMWMWVAKSRRCWQSMY